MDPENISTEMAVSLTSKLEELRKCTEDTADARFDFRSSCDHIAPSAATAVSTVFALVYRDWALFTIMAVATLLSLLMWRVTWRNYQKWRGLRKHLGIVRRSLRMEYTGATQRVFTQIVYGHGVTPEMQELVKAIQSVQSAITMQVQIDPWVKLRKQHGSSH